MNIRVTEKTEDAGWLVLIYRVPPEPTRLRSTVWRRIKSLGAIYLQNSAAALPASAGTERALRKLRREIIEMSGTAVLLSCSVLAGESEAQYDAHALLYSPDDHTLALPVDGSNAGVPFGHQTVLDVFQVDRATGAPLRNHGGWCGGVGSRLPVHRVPPGRRPQPSSSPWVRS